MEKTKKMLDEGIAIEKDVRKPDQVNEFNTSQEQTWLNEGVHSEINPGPGSKNADPRKQ